MLSFAYRQLILTPKVPPPKDLSGKTALVTGGTSGIGLECSFQLLELGLSRLIITSRSLSRGQKAKDALLSRLEAAEQRAPVSITEKPEIHVYILDQNAFASVAEFLDSLKAKFSDSLDIALLNAGVRRWVPSTAATGYEEMVQVHHLTTSLLLLTLPAIMRKGGLISVNSSELHGHTEFRQRSQPEAVKYVASIERPDFDVVEQYGLSKLLNILFIRELVNRITPENSVTINIANPGLVVSNLGMDDVNNRMPTIQRLLGLLFVKIFGRKTEVGSRVLTDAVLRGPDSHGEYLNGRGIELPLSPLVLSEEGAKLQKKIWDETIEILRAESEVIFDLP